MARRDLIAAARKAAYPALCALAAALVLLAALSVAARWLLADADDYRDEFAAIVGDALGVELEVAGLRARPRGRGLTVTASGLVLRSAPLPMSMREATVEFDLLRSLFSMRPRISAVRAAGATLDLAAPDARLSGALVAALFGDDGAGVTPPDLYIEDALVRWRDTVTGETRRFENARFALHRTGFSGGGLRALIETDLPPALGRRLRLVFDVPDVAVSASASFHADLDAVEIGGGCELATGERCWEGRVSGKLWGAVDRGDVRLGWSEALLQPGAADAPAFPLGGNARWSGAGRRSSFVLTLADLPLAHVPAWLPAETLPPRFAAWLRRALRAGRVARARVSFAGAPADFSFVEDVRVSADITGAEVDYRKGRPSLRDVDARVVFEGGALRVSASRVQILDTRSDHAVVTIADVRRPLLSVDARARGPLADVLSYLRVIGLFDAYGVTTAHLTASGDSRLRLIVKTPLDREVEHATLVEGTLDFEGSGLSFPALRFGFDDVRGSLAFDRDGGRADEIEAEWRSHPVAIRARTTDGGTLVAVGAKFAPYPAFADLAPAFADFVSGEARWNAEVFIPNPGRRPAPAGGATFGVRLTSDLRGLAVDLPSPLGKGGGETRPLLFETGLGASSWRAAYGGLHVASSGVGAARRGALEPAATLNVRGVVEERTDFGEWMRWWRMHGDDVGDGGFAPPEALHLVFRRAAVGGEALGTMELKTMRARDGQLKLHLDSAPIRGEMAFAKAGATAPRVYVDLARLHLTGAMFEGPSSELPDPAALPPLALKIGEFRMDGIAADDLRVVTNPAGPGMEISKASFRSLEDGRAITDVSLAGSWIGGDNPRSDVEFSLASEDYGSLLRLWGFRTGLRGGRGEVRGRVAWNDDLPRFGLDKIEGDVAIALRDGTVETVEPGVGKLLGLLNISEIAQRFTLDFRDVFNKGLVFEDLRGDLSFGGGNMTTDNFTVESSSLDMTIRGRTGIAARDYDQRIEVVPHVSTAVPLLSALVAGPVYAAVVYVVGKTTRLDEAVDRSVALNYTLTGTWEDPKVDFVGVPGAPPAP